MSNWGEATYILKSISGEHVEDIDKGWIKDKWKSFKESLGIKPEEASKPSKSEYYKKLFKEAEKAPKSTPLREYLKSRQKRPEPKPEPKRHLEPPKGSGMALV